MNANKRELILKDEVYSVVSCSMEIINGLGHGLHKKPYENALVVEFEYRCIPYEQQKAFPVNWRGQRVGQFIADLIAYNQIAVDTKTIDRITNIESGQMLNYLRVTQLPLGLIINFKQPKLQWERIILSQ